MRPICIKWTTAWLSHVMLAGPVSGRGAATPAAVKFMYPRSKSSCVAVTVMVQFSGGPNGSSSPAEHVDGLVISRLFSPTLPVLWMWTVQVSGSPVGSAKTSAIHDTRVYQCLCAGHSLCLFPASTTCCRAVNCKPWGQQGRADTCAKPVHQAYLLQQASHCSPAP